MSEENNAHSEVKATDVKTAHGDTHHKKDKKHVPSAEHNEATKQNIVNAENLGDNITTEQAAVARQGFLNRQRNEMEEVISPEQQIAEAQIAEIDQRRAMVTEKLKELAAQQEIVKQKLQKPKNNVATTGAVVAGLTTALGFAANKFGDAASAAKNLLENTAKAVSGAAEGADIRNIINTKVKGKLGENVDDNLLRKMSNSITADHAKLIDKKGIEETVKVIGEKIAPNAGKIADEVMKGTKEGDKITEIITDALTEKGWFGAIRKAADSGLVNSAKSSVDGIIDNRNKLLEPTKDLTEAFREKMPSFIVKPVDFYNSIPGGRAKDVGVIVGIGLFAAGIQYAMTSKEREERAQAKEYVNELSEDMANGQEFLVHLNRKGKEIKGNFSEAVVNQTPVSIHR
jgi:hypothetical protein